VQGRPRARPRTAGYAPWPRRLRPGGIGCEPSRRNVGQGSVDEIGEGGDPDMTISLRAIVELARSFITAAADRSTGLKA
jgi:hypothetical protein